jgi:hypothetical protein
MVSSIVSIKNVLTKIVIHVRLTIYIIHNHKNECSVVPNKRAYAHIINSLNNLFMKKKVITLSCIAAVAIATFVGTKVLQSNVYENGLLSQNVEALSRGDYYNNPPIVRCVGQPTSTCYVNVGSNIMMIYSYRNK